MFPWSDVSTYVLLSFYLLICWLISILWIPTFVGFVGTEEPIILIIVIVFKEWQIFLRNIYRLCQNLEINYQRMCKFSSNHEYWYPRKYKWILSTAYHCVIPIEYIYFIIPSQQKFSLQYHGILDVYFICPMIKSNEFLGLVHVLLSGKYYIMTGILTLMTYQ